MERSLNLRQNFVIFSILASLWLLKHPYYGIWHDGVIYTFMALKDLYPDVFASDLFIKFGSQYNFTLFPQIYAGLINSFGIYKSALLLTVVGQLLWIFAAVTLFRIFLKGKELYISLAIVFFMSAFYGGFYCLRYAEPFVNPRIFSEAFCILGAICILKNRYIFSASFIFLSFLMHPLITMCACLIFYVYLVLTYPRILFSAPLLAAAALLLGFFKIEPLAGLFRIIPPEWHQIIKVRSSFMLFSQWPLSSLAELFYTTSITAAACLFSKGSMRRLFLASIMGAYCGILVNIIGGEILKIELIMQIQAWRALWFLQFISALGATVIIINFLKLKNNKLLLCCFFLLTCYSTHLGVISFGITLIFLYLCVRVSRNDLPPVNVPRPTVFLIIVIIIIICIIISSITGPISIFIKNDFNIKLLAPTLESIPLDLFTPSILFLVIFFFEHYWDKKPAFKIVFLSFAVLVFSLAVWDRQSPGSKMLESNEDDTAFFRNILPKDATILWDNSPEVSWFGARRPSYVSAQQGSGIVFYQKTALEYAKRINTILPFMDENPLTSEKIGYKLGWGLNKKKFKSNYTTVCRNAEELDYIVSTENVPGKSIAYWRSIVPIIKTRKLEDGTYEVSRDNDFYLYDCKGYRTAKH
ncbi:MAG: hypothetical protein JW976_13895 [Syntrophaceae bacterium]|nr:hypothetical protein [Syntrophaceae bacterium]